MGLGGWAGLPGVPTGVPGVRQTVGVAEVVLEAVTEETEGVLMSKLAAAAAAVMVVQKQGQHRGRAAGCSPEQGVPGAWVALSGHWGRWDIQQLGH